MMLVTLWESGASARRQTTVAFPDQEDRLPVSLRHAGIAGTGMAALFAPATPSTAGEALELYGRINVTVQQSDDGTGEKTELKSNASRVGVKGEKALRAGLKVIYQLEWGVNIDNDEDDDHFTPRNQFIGIEGAFGTIKAGRHDTALKEAQGEFDLFDDLEGDIARVFNGENRLKNYIGYTTPTFADTLLLTVNFFPGEDDSGGNGGVADGTSVSLVYETDLLYAAIAHDRDLDGEEVRTLRLVGGRTFGDVQLMLLYQRTEADGSEEDGLGASLAWALGDYVAKFQYQAADLWRIVPGGDSSDPRLDSHYSVGVDRHFGEDTRLFAFYTGGEIDRSGERVSYLALGIEHQF